MILHTAHVVCPNPDCGHPGIARVEAVNHPMDVTVTCPYCKCRFDVCFGGLCPFEHVDEPDAPPVDEAPSWLRERRRMVGIRGSRAADEPARWNDPLA
jgi:hypothetical protein